MQICPTLVLFCFRALTKSLWEVQQNSFMVFRNCAISQTWSNILKGSFLLQTVTVWKNTSEDETQHHIVDFDEKTVKERKRNPTINTQLNKHYMNSEWDFSILT